MRKVASLVAYLLLSACVDPISFNAPALQPQLVVDGMITDEAGPYTVTLTMSRSINQYSITALPIDDATVRIRSDAGETENLLPVPDQPGVYTTTSIQGVVGRSYSITIKRSDGREYESTPEKLSAAGSVERIKYEFQQQNPVIGGVRTIGGIFKIFSDGKVSAAGESYVRWRVNGTYKVQNFPAEKVKYNGEERIPDPEPCSGFVNRNGFLNYVAPCTCCYCWVSEFGTPTVNDTRLVSGGALNNIRVGTVTVNRRTFFDKYRVEVEMMSLTQQAYDFWKLVEAQREGASSLFQPPLAQVKGNVRNTGDASEVVQGYFGAAGVTRKSIYLSKDNVPLYLPPIDTITYSCQRDLNTTNIQPPFWK